MGSALEYVKMVLIVALAAYFLVTILILQRYTPSFRFGTPQPAKCDKNKELVTLY